MTNHGGRAVYFDAVGTLIHLVRPVAEVYAEVGGRHGSRLPVSLIADRFRIAFAGQELIDRERSWRTSEERERQRWSSIVAEVLDGSADPDACFRELFDYFARPEAWTCLPGTATLLEQLAEKGCQIGIASNFDRRLRGIAEVLPELRAIKRLVISSEVGHRKPSAAFFGAICDSCGLPPEQIVHVGDDYANDYAGAAAAGLVPILFDPNGKQPTLESLVIGH